jgi:hypothetical protein
MIISSRIRLRGCSLHRTSLRFHGELASTLVAPKAPRWQLGTEAEKLSVEQISESSYFLRGCAFQSFSGAGGSSSSSNF